MPYLTDQEQKVLSAAICHQTYYPKKSESKEFSLWCNLVYQDLKNNKLEEISNNNDIFINYWPSYFLFSTSENYKRAYFERQHYLYKNGEIATGYTIVTLKNLYLVMFKETTIMFPLYSQGVKGFVFDVIGRMAGEVDNIRPLKENRSSRLEIASIKVVEIGHDHVGNTGVWVYTRGNQFFIKNLFKGDLQEIEVAINMVKSGKLAKELESIQSNSSPDEAIKDRENQYERLKQLNLMLQQGLISDSEFEIKKKEILARL